MKKRKPSERTRFERWWNDAMGTPRAEIRALRDWHGYSDRNLDYAYMGWKARAEVQLNEQRHE